MSYVDDGLFPHVVPQHLTFAARGPKSVQHLPEAPDRGDGAAIHRQLGHLQQHVPSESFTFDCASDVSHR